MEPQTQGYSCPQPTLAEAHIAAADRSTAARIAAMSSETAIHGLEQERLAALHSLAILDTQGEQQYDDLTHLASYICGTSMALISLVDKDRQWFKSKVGVALEGTARSESVCAYTIQQPGLFIVEDATQDERFSSMPLVTGGVFRFYAGAPISTVDGHKIGSLCVLDEKPRELSEEQKQALLVLSRSATAYLAIRGQVQQLLKNADERRAVEYKLRENHALLEEANRQLQLLAATDSLTGLPNRRVLEANLNDLRHSPAVAGRPLSALMIDVDHFKRVNDTFSHETGDLVLKRVAELLRSSVRGTDLVSRYGGEEFVILMRAATSEVALKQAERLRAAVAGDTLGAVPVTISIGVATVTCEQWQQELPSLLPEADKALYAAKHGGRNCVRSANQLARQ
jgi:diguanylate cyclase (GGDEF)-like protein